MDTNVDRQTGSLDGRLPDLSAEPVVRDVSVCVEGSRCSRIVFAVGASLGSVDGAGCAAVFASALTGVVAAESTVFVLKPFAIGWS